jgi:serine/threonine protein kinase
MIIGNYRLIEKIGEGGMAAVYKAEHNTLGNILAVKILNEDLHKNQNIRHRFLSEAKNMAKMSHPNIIKVSDLIDHENKVAIVMEFIEGETLKDFLDKRGKLTEAELKTMFMQMLDAVEYVHQLNLVHRDIKPSNFMITKKGVLKLLDFGIAKNTDKASLDYTQTGTMQTMGTPMYMSPEQVKSTKEVTAQSDVYSLGVVLWQMVMGIRPYDTNTTSNFELQTKIVNEPLSITNTIFDSVIQKATAKNLENRFANCSEIKFYLQNSTDTDLKNKNRIIGSTSSVNSVGDDAVANNLDATIVIDKSKKGGFDLGETHEGKQNTINNSSEKKSISGFQYFINAFIKYATFEGRARRKEYWYFVLFSFIINFLLALFFAPLSLISQLALLLPNIAVSVRRMHDVGKSGWFILIPIYNLILFFTNGDDGQNDYGSDPKNE